MTKHDNAIIDDDEALDMLRQLLTWGYEKSDILIGIEHVQEQLGWEED